VAKLKLSVNTHVEPTRDQRCNSKIGDRLAKAQFRRDVLSVAKLELSVYKHFRVIAESLMPQRQMM
jgi:hypothetical protein